MDEPCEHWWIPGYDGRIDAYMRICNMCGRIESTRPIPGLEMEETEMDVMEAKEIAVLDHVRELKENVEALDSVLEGTWGMAKAEETRETDVGILTVEDRLNAIRVGIVGAIGNIQGIRERLQRHLAELA